MNTFRCSMVALALIAFSTSNTAVADAVAKTDGKVVSGKVLGMEEGNLIVETQQGINRVEIGAVREFSIDEKEESRVSEQMINQMMSAQNQILQRLDLLTQSLANLERQLLNVQSTQQIQAHRLTQRTREVNPLQQLIVIGQQVGRSGGNTVVTGQVANQSETPITNVQVDVYVHGSSGRLRNEGGQKKVTVFTQPPTLAPGQAGVFSAAFPDGYKVDNVTFDVRGLPPYGYSVNPPNGRAATGDF